MKSDVLQLVTDLSNGLADTTRVDAEYSEILSDIANSLKMWLEAQLVTLAAGTAVYPLPDGLIYLRAVLYDDRELLEESRQGLEAYNANWRDEQSDTPLAFYLETEADRTVRLVPSPTINTKDWVPVFGLPLGLDYPPYSICAIGSILRDPFQLWLNLYVALRILEAEFFREGANQDVDFAGLCGSMATLVLSGVMVPTDYGAA